MGPCGAEILGIEIAAGARVVHEHPFRGPTAFILGNEGTGLSKQQAAICDGFVYIAQYGARPLLRFARSTAPQLRRGGARRQAQARRR